MGKEKYEGTSGVTPMNIAGRLVSDRERLHGMTVEERAWRRKWLADQVLHANEPRYVVAARKDLLNPIRRFYRAPLDFIFEKGFQPVIGKDAALVFRFYTGRILMGLFGLFAMKYYFNNNTNTWQSKSSWRIIENRSALYPGDPGYGVPVPVKPPHEYHDRGFKDSLFAKEFPQYQDK